MAVSYPDQKLLVTKLLYMLGISPSYLFYLFKLSLHAWLQHCLNCCSFIKCLYSGRGKNLLLLFFSQISCHFLYLSVQVPLIYFYQIQNVLTIRFSKGIKIQLNNSLGNICISIVFNFLRTSIYLCLFGILLPLIEF